MPRHVHTLLGALTIGCVLALAASAQAQDKPPLKILVGFPPGGSADVIARLIAEQVGVRS